MRSSATTLHMAARSPDLEWVRGSANAISSTHYPFY